MSNEEEFTRTAVEQVAHELMGAAPSNWQHCPEVARSIDYLIKLRIEQALRTNAAIGPDVIARIRKAWDA